MSVARLVAIAGVAGLIAASSVAHAKRGRARAPDPPASPIVSGEETKVAIVELGALGLSQDMLSNLLSLLQNSMGTIESVNIISHLDVEIALRKPSNRALLDCGGGPRCAVKIGRVVGADVAVFGNIGAIGENFNLNLRAVDTKTGRELARQQTSISGNRDLLIPEMRLAAFRLIAPERIRGSLVVEIDVEGVEIEIDGKKVGVTPLDSPVGNLSPGDHVVVLRREGYSEFQQEFTIKPFETARLKLDLKKAEKK